MTAPRLGYGELTEGQDVPETTVNEMTRYLEQGAGHFIIKDRDLATPPGSPAQGDCYLVATSPTGAWASNVGDLAFYMGSAWEFITPIEGFTAWVNDEDVFIGYDGSSWSTLIDPNNPIESIIIACSDETTDLATAAPAVTFRMPYAFTLTEVRASVNTAPTGAALQVDINESAATILSTKLTIDAGEKTSTTAATAAVISDSSLADDAEITIDIDQVGSTVAGKGLKVALIGRRT